MDSMKVMDAPLLWDAQELALKFALLLLAASCSAALINLNKYLMAPEVFPHAVPLVTCHIIMTFSFSLLGYYIYPSAYVSMERAKERKLELFKLFTPVAMFAFISVVCSNMAYMYCSVAFLQFMKDWNVAIVFFLSVLAGSQECSLHRTCVLLWICISCSVAITGDMNFSRLGFLFQLLCQIADPLKLVLQEKLLSGDNFKIDSLTYQIFIGPPTLGFLLISNIMHWDPDCIPAFIQWWPAVLGSGLLAVGVNITMTMVVKYTGAVAFVLMTMVKNIGIVVLSVYLSGQPLNLQQIAGFSCSCAGIAYWGLLKAGICKEYKRLREDEASCDEALCENA